MDSLIFSLNSTIPIFLVMIVGWVIRRIGIVDENFATTANRYVFKVALPVLLFKDLASANFKSDFNLKFVLFCCIVTVLMFSLTWLFTEIFMKDDSQKGAFIQGSCRSSAAILGIAFVESIYSDAGMAPLMIVAAVPLFNIFAVIILTFKAHPELHGNVAISGDINTDKIKQALINIAKNPIIIGILLGFISSMLGLNYPTIISKTISNLSQTATPIALICIGASFQGRQAIKKIKPTFVATFIKLILLPAIFVPIGIFMGFKNQELIAILIMLASPTTVTSFVMAKAMDNDEVLSSSIVVLTTLLSSITLTGWIFILRYFSLI
mgnify:CR=1 FL=1